MSLQRKLKVALDETRLLILGTQVLFGFQLNATFQEAFDKLPALAKQANCAGTMLLMVAIGLLIGAPMQHRIIEEGHETNRILRAVAALAGCALLPIGLAIGVDVFMGVERAFGVAAGLWTGGALCALALLLWYVLGFALKRKRPMPEEEKPTPLATKVEHMLTEARVIIPGAQALIGFQLTVTMTRAFEQLPPSSKLIHILALGCVVLAVILLMAPAALHRIAFGGEDAPEFLRLGSMFVIAAPLPLALGIALDVQVACGRALDSAAGATSLAAFSLIALVGLWYAYPLWRRRQLQA
jgi:hypothetical protein